MTMTSDSPPTSGPSWLLTDLARRVPEIQRVLLVSADGLKVAADEGFDTDDADRLAAAASSLWATARTTGEASGIGPAVAQVGVEFDGHMLFVCSAGAGSVLTVLAHGAANAGLVGYEMGQLTKRVREALDTPARQAAADRSPRDSSPPP
jgi:predicted regulator of Ras-like GTPase activity (Roadblock/LC7/MglB family)